MELHRQGSAQSSTVFKVTPAVRSRRFSSRQEQGTDGSALTRSDAGHGLRTSTGPPNPAGAGGAGTVFKITQRETLTTLHSFNIHDGPTPTPRWFRNGRELLVDITSTTLS